MSSEKKYSIWPALVMIALAIVLPVTIGTIELRIARNSHAETAAIDYLQSVAKAENDYRQANNGFSAKLDDLKGVPQPEAFYKFGYRQVTADSYIMLAWPKEPGKHGKRYFFMDQTGVVRYEALHAAGPASEPVPPIEKK